MIKNIHRQTSVPCKNMKELKRLLWWAKKTGYRWSNGQPYDDNYMITFLEDKFQNGVGITVMPVIGMWAYSSNSTSHIMALNNFIRTCKENHFQNIRV